MVLQNIFEFRFKVHPMKAHIQQLMMSALMLALSASLQGQITIYSSDYPLSPGTDLVASALFPSEVPLPEEGGDKIYDYSTLQRSDMYSIKLYDGSKNPAFPDATIMQRSVSYTLKFPIYEQSYEAITEDAYYGVGKTQLKATYSLSEATGSDSDYIHIPRVDLEYPSKRAYVKFPMTYGDAWEETEVVVTQFELTMPAYELQNTPCEIIEYKNTSREVVGYGNLILPDEDGSPSRPIEVLLVKIREVKTDSIFMDGELAPADLVYAFLSEQGETSITEGYVFEMKGLGRQPLMIPLADDGRPEEVLFRPKAVELTSVPGFKKHDLAIYPSIVGPGQVITVGDGASYESQRVELVGVQGRVIELKNLQNNQFRIPSGLQPGLYFVRQIGAASQLISGRIIIKQ